MAGNIVWTNKQPTPEEIEAQRLEVLAEAKSAALARITAAVQGLRLRLVTPLPGQEAIYLQKQAEAARYVANPGPLDGFPFLAAEVGVTAPTAEELAQLWLNMAHIFAVVGSVTERARKAAEGGIAAAGDLDAVNKAEALFMAAMEALG